MTVLVTGGAGYIGSHTVLELLDAGEPAPVVLDDLSTGFRWSVPDGAPLVVGDFGDESLVSDLIARHNVDEIIHFAAKIVVPDSVADPLGYYLNNTAKARTLLATSVARGVKRFIFSSTAAVYGDPLHNPVTEDEPLDYPTPDGTCVRDYIQVTDLSRAHLDALRYLRDGGANLTANCGYERGFSVLEVIESVKRVSGVDFDVEMAPRRPGDPAAIVAANERIRRTLGWTPQYDNLDEIVRQALEWEKHLMARGG